MVLGSNLAYTLNYGIYTVFDYFISPPLFS